MSVDIKKGINVLSSMGCGRNCFREKVKLTITLQVK